MRWITPTAQSRAWIMSFTGRHVTPLQPTTAMITIEDIAHHLSHEARYNGATREFYSVAEHSVRVSWLVPAPFAFEALLHDASEAYLKDIPAPLKRQDQFAEYRAAEVMMEHCIAAKFGLERIGSAPVKHYDKVLGATERRDLMRNDEAWVPACQPWENGTILPWSPEDARAMYLRRYSDLVMRDYGTICALGYCRSCHGVTVLGPDGAKPLIGGFWRHVCGDCGGDFGHQLVRADAPAGWQP